MNANILENHLIKKKLNEIFIYRFYNYAKVTLHTYDMYLSENNETMYLIL